MRTCVFILPLLAACGFSTTPFPTDHDVDPRVWTSDGVVTVREGDGAVRVRARDAAMGVAGSMATDAAAAPADADVEMDAALPTDAASPIDSGAAPDSSSPPDAAAPPPDSSLPPDAAEPPPDAAEPDAAEPKPDYTDERICQPCGGEPCGPQSACIAVTGGGSLCLPRTPTNKDCVDVCRGYLPTMHNGVCKHADSAAACNVVLLTRACWN